MEKFVEASQPDLKMKKKEENKKIFSMFFTSDHGPGMRCVCVAVMNKLPSVDYILYYTILHYNTGNSKPLLCTVQPEVVYRLEDGQFHVHPPFT